MATLAPITRYTPTRCGRATNGQIFRWVSKSAFLTGDLTEEYDVEQPPDFEISERKNMVYRLHKALYGLKQAPKAWYEKIDAFLLSWVSTLLQPTISMSSLKMAYYASYYMLMAL